jgi:hypothetical protein
VTFVIDICLNRLFKCELNHNAIIIFHFAELSRAFLVVRVVRIHPKSFNRRSCPKTPLSWEDFRSAGELVTRLVLARDLVVVVGEKTTVEARSVSAAKVAIAGAVAAIAEVVVATVEVAAATAEAVADLALVAAMLGAVGVSVFVNFAVGTLTS